VAFAEEYDDGMEELLLDSLVAGATGLHEILTEPLTAREVIRSFSEREGFHIVNSKI